MTLNQTVCNVFSLHTKPRLRLSSPTSLITELVMCGVAYHHAGLDSSDRKSIEAMFTNGDLPVLCMKVILNFFFEK